VTFVAWLDAVLNALLHPLERAVRLELRDLHIDIDVRVSDGGQDQEEREDGRIKNGRDEHLGVGCVPDASRPS
jgi:hypothetical protein